MQRSLAWRAATVGSGIPSGHGSYVIETWSKGCKSIQTCQKVCGKFCDTLVAFIVAIFWFDAYQIPSLWWFRRSLNVMKKSSQYERSWKEDWPRPHHKHPYWLRPRMTCYCKVLLFQYNYGVLLSFLILVVVSSFFNPLFFFKFNIGVFFT